MLIIKKLMQGFLFFLLLLSAASIFADTQFCKPEAVPGGVVILPITSADHAQPELFYNKMRVMTLQQNGKWVAIVGVPLSAKVGTDYLTVNSVDSNQKIPFTIQPKTYPSQYLTIKNKQMVTLNDANLKRFLSEWEIIHKAMINWRDKDNINMHFLMPVQGEITSQFGFKRVLNGEPRSPHQGIDIAAKLGAPIVAPANGIVTLTGNYYLTGKTILIDHGQGLVTIYCHLNKILVTEGQKVKAGDEIGLVGKTGRVTGPNLHFGISLNDAEVNPLLFMD